MIKTPLTYNPWTGEALPRGHERFAHHYDGVNSRWLYNPWTGTRRPAAEVEADPCGLDVRPLEPEAPPTPACAPVSPLRFSPNSGRAFAARVFTASLYRETHPRNDWFFNPWTGSRRPAAEVEADPQGLKLEPPSHDPGTTSPPTPATTEAGTATQEPGATDHEPASTSSPTPCAAPSAMNAVLSSLGAAVAEVNALTRTAVELSAKCRALQERNCRLQERNDELVNRCRELDRLVDAAVKIRTPAEEAQAGPHMRAAAGEGDARATNQELLSLLQDAVASFAGCVEGGEADPWVKNSRAAIAIAIAKATGSAA